MPTVHRHHPLKLELAIKLYSDTHVPLLEVQPHPREPERKWQRERLGAQWDVWLEMATDGAGALRIRGLMVRLLPWHSLSMAKSVNFWRRTVHVRVTVWPHVQTPGHSSTV